MTVRILHGDCRKLLRTLPAESVHMVMSSPPYWGLRDYGNAEGGIGLEPTLQEHVENIVAVFAEVWRVLRPDGTVWLNYGDCYAASPRGNRKPGGGNLTNSNIGSDVEDARWRAARNRPVLEGWRRDGLKPKDLCLLPARIALALQQPFYTGKIKDERDRIWLAAMIDGEGCMFIHKRKVGQDNGNGYKRKTATYGAGLEVANCSRAIALRCAQITGKGSIFRHEKNRRRPLFRWQLRSNECRDIIREVYPHLVAKQHEARLLLGCPSSGDQASRAHQGLIALHAGKDPGIDFPPPASLFAPGWYVRSEIIWSKKNPMPESVKDRPTSAHEKLFLLTKSARYFYDAQAVRVPAKCPDGPNAADKIKSPYGQGFARRAAEHEDTARPPGTRPHTGLSNAAGQKPVRGRSTHGRHTLGEALPANERRQRGEPPRHEQYDTGHLSLDNAARGAGANLRNVWPIATKPYSDAHFATFPPEIVEPCIKAGTSEKGVCSSCGAPWLRQVGTAQPAPGRGSGNKARKYGRDRGGNPDRPSGQASSVPWSPSTTPTVGWLPSCDCDAGAPVPAIVLDPFGGAGTVGLVADSLGRDAILIELNADYCVMAERRLKAGLVPVEGGGAQEDDHGPLFAAESV